MGAQMRVGCNAWIRALTHFASSSLPTPPPPCALGVISDPDSGELIGSPDTQEDCDFNSFNLAELQQILKDTGQVRQF